MRHIAVFLFCAGMAQASVITGGTIQISLQGYHETDYSLIVDGLNVTGIGERDFPDTQNFCNGSTYSCQSSIGSASMRVFASINTAPPFRPQKGTYISDIELAVNASPIMLVPVFGLVTYDFTFTYTGFAAVYPFYDFTQNIPQPPCLICEGNISGVGTGSITIEQGAFGTPATDQFIPQSEALTFAPEPSTFVLGFTALVLLAWCPGKDISHGGDK